MKDKIKVANYGEMLSQINGYELVSFEEDGGYQGDYLVVLKDIENKRLLYYVGSYGSCSGCDWLEDNRDWDTGEVSYKDALDYCGGIKPQYIVPETHPMITEKLGKYEGFNLHY